MPCCWRLHRSPASCGSKSFGQCLCAEGNSFSSLSCSENKLDHTMEKLNLGIFICRQVSCENINLLIYKTLPAVSALMVHKAVSAMMVHKFLAVLFFSGKSEIPGNVLFLFKAQH